jgi:hypothetical protein
MNHCDTISNNMIAYRNLYYYLEGTFDGCEVSHFSRASNEEADTLANIRSQCLLIPLGVFWEEIVERSIRGAKPSGASKQNPQPAEDSGADITMEGDNAKPEEVMMVEVMWMQPYL